MTRGVPHYSRGDDAGGACGAHRLAHGQESPVEDPGCHLTDAERPESRLDVAAVDVAIGVTVPGLLSPRSTSAASSANHSSATLAKVEYGVTSDAFSGAAVSFAADAPRNPARSAKPSGVIDHGVARVDDIEGAWS